MGFLQNRHGKHSLDNDSLPLNASPQTCVVPVEESFQKAITQPLIQGPIFTNIRLLNDIPIRCYY
jgi:hypothetical protein